MENNVNTLHTLGQVPQVENVVGFGRGRQKVGAQAEVDLHRGGHDRLAALSDGVRKVDQETG